MDFLDQCVVTSSSHGSNILETLSKLSLVIDAKCKSCLRLLDRGLRSKIKSMTLLVDTIEMKNERTIRSDLISRHVIKPIGDSCL